MQLREGGGEVEAKLVLDDGGRGRRVGIKNLEF